MATGPGGVGVGDGHCESMEDKACRDGGGRRAVLWLQCSLRLADNPALLRAVEQAENGLAVVFVWRHGQLPSTASAVFECAAAHSLNKALRELGNRLVVLHSDDDDVKAAKAVAQVVHATGAQLAVVDASGECGTRSASLLESGLLNLGNSATLEIFADSHLLLPFDVSCKALGRSRTGGKILRWPTYLRAAACLEIAPPVGAPHTLPPPLLNAPAFDSMSAAGGLTAPLPLPDPASSGGWARTLLRTWPVSEETALQLARAAVSATAQDDIGERPRAPPGVSKKKAKRAATSGLKPSRLSPYLRWGVISARQAAAAGMRTRELLWRDWSHVCWQLLYAPRRALPALAVLDGCCCLNTREGGGGGGGGRGGGGGGGGGDGESNVGGDRGADGSDASHRFDESLTVADSERDVTVVTASSKRALPWPSLNAAFEAWCVGKTGSALVDAGMRQLWVEGWMPRRVRLLCAACLTEGMGVDYRLGREWFAKTLIDHDFAINEAMWQNAGLCGIDPFYRALRWEEAEQVSGDPEYIEKWLHADLKWAPVLRAAASCESPSISAISRLALLRRADLQTSYRRAGRVAMVGVRMDADGHIIGIGKQSIERALGPNPKTKKHARRSNLPLVAIACYVVAMAAVKLAPRGLIKQLAL